MSQPELSAGHTSLIGAVAVGAMTLRYGVGARAWHGQLKVFSTGGRTMSFPRECGYERRCGQRSAHEGEDKYRVESVSVTVGSREDRLLYFAAGE